MLFSLQQVLQWAEQGHVDHDQVVPALRAIGVIPDRQAWRVFLDGLLIGLGILMLGAGVLFFFAYNWNDLHRYAKFGLIEVAIVMALLVVWRLGLVSTGGKAALCLAAVLVGVLLALAGQTYQTGADPYELFLYWALFILPWALIARLPVLWLLWLTLINLTIVLYERALGSPLALIDGPHGTFWLLFIVNTIALIVWELLAHRRIAWLDEPWSKRVVLTASGVSATMLGLYSVVDDAANASSWGLAAWLSWLIGIYLVYRVTKLDLYALAGGVLSAIVVVTALLGRLFLIDGRGVEGGFLIIALFVIGASGGGGVWLNRLNNGEAH